mgnify:CR=1 FL=1
MVTSIGIRPIVSLHSNVRNLGKDIIGGFNIVL